MPSVSAYKKGFGVKKDLIVTSQSGVEWTVKRCAIEHIEAIKYERYEFPTVLVLTSSTGSVDDKDANDAKETLAAYVSEAKIIPSDFGNPYECHFGEFKATIVQEKGEPAVELKSRGWAVRRYDIDASGNAVEPKAEKTLEEKRAQREETKRLKAALPGYRLITSSYSSSKCATCGERLGPGVRIAKREGSTEKGGWSHVDCLLEKKGIVLTKIDTTAAPQDESKAKTKKRKRADSNGDQDADDKGDQGADSKEDEGDRKRAARKGGRDGDGGGDKVRRSTRTTAKAKAEVNKAESKAKTTKGPPTKKARKE